MKNKWQTKKLLIVGIPGMGKTRIGNYLQEKYDFIHTDMECENNIAKIIAAPSVFIDELVAQDRNLVVTWGFVPSDQLINIVNSFKDYDFKIIWFDGDRDAARREFVQRDSQYGNEYLNGQMGALELQLNRIIGSDVIKRINPKIINTFNSKHHFKKLDAIYKEIKNV